MFEQGIDAFAATMDNVEDTFRQAGLFQQLRNFDGSEGDLFAGLQDERVAADQSHRIHPQRHHRRKVKRRYADAHTDGLTNSIAINAARDVLNALAHQQRWDATSELHHLDASPNVPARFDECLAVFAGIAANEVFEIF